MNVKYVISRVERVFQDNPSLIMLAVCGAAAALFIGLMFLPRFFRRMKRRLREKRRRVRAEFKKQSLKFIV